MPSLNETDFEILKLLWKNRQLSGREIHDLVSKENGWAYSTTRTTIERMVKKGLIRKSSYHGLNIYIPAVSKVRAFAIQISQFADKILERDAMSVLPLFTNSAALTESELRELKSLLKSDEDLKL